MAPLKPGGIFGCGLLIFAVLLHIKNANTQDPAPNVIDALAGLKTQLNTVNSTADLLCESSRMVVNLTFAKPFFGKIFAENNDTDQRCWLRGTGARTYQYAIPLKECGTRQISLREFENTLQVRYGPKTDEIQLEDERKTILCRYPPPVVPPIIPPPPPVAGAPPIVPKASVSELELLLIIAAVLFLGLLLLGLCCAWWCCKRRAAAKAVESEGVLIEAPDVMKLAGTTVPFLDIRIPRATASTAGSDVSESALIQRLEESENFPVVPHGENEIMRIPHVTQLSKGYELQEATMVIPAGGDRPSEASEGGMETEIVEEIERGLIPPIPLRPPSPLQRTELERETRTDQIETELEHTLIAGRRMQRLPSSEPPLDMRSVTELSEESITRRTALPKPPPIVPKLPPKMSTTELETETHSVTESLENELILRAVPKKQPRMLPPMQLPLDSTTETTVTEEVRERIYPARGDTTTTTLTERSRIAGPQDVTTVTTTTDETRILEKLEQPPVPPPPLSTTTRNVKETNVRRIFDIYADRPPPTMSPARPPETTTTHTTTTDIRRREIGVPFNVPPAPVTTTTTTKETDIRREYEYAAPPPPPVTTTQTTTETNIHRDYMLAQGAPPIRYAPSTRETSTSFISEEHRIPPRPVYGPDTTTKTTTTTEENIHREFDAYTSRTMPPPMGPLSSTFRTVQHQRFGRRPFPLEQDTNAVLRDTSAYATSHTEDFREETHTGSRRHPYYPDSGSFTERTTQRLESESYPSGEYAVPSTAGTHDQRFISTATRNIQKELDIGTPPKSSTPDDASVRESVTHAKTTRSTDIRRDLDVMPPTFIPRPTLSENRGTETITTTERRDSRRGYAIALPTIRPFEQTSEFDEPRHPVTWTQIQRVLDEDTNRNRTSVYQISLLPSADVERLQDLMHYDQQFQSYVTRVRTVYDLYYISFQQPYDTYFSQSSWTIIIRIFINVLDLPRPHPGEPGFVEPEAEWFIPPHPAERHSDMESVATTAQSYAERALSEFTEEVPHINPARFPGQSGSDGSDAGSSYFGSVARRGGSEYAVSERSVSEYFENAPTIPFTRTSRQVRTVQRVEEETTSEL
ncbi:uncharacterized protein LOC129593469 [Paramacrobiotus metropolitanus]|uniref:uncharacterized protein LOC129593469 n=1 Tax=Paramacrobiotus metropolitanus TaxID=2943436 RepID=UPI002446418B|nr:uncharacterized protein LOC129593469 [Paramacrobiotus metropolitanus]XP_055345772.1 uncharacterized protein LOC129593469 [Paramacrobiotus metropolitanus]